jgi:hypothetical protein
LATLRPDLGGSFLEFDLAMQARGYIAQRVLPVFESAVQSGPFGKIPIEQLLQNRDTARAPGSGYSRGQFTFTTDSFACDEHGSEEVVDDRQAKMYANYFDAELISALRAREVVLSNAERRAAALIFNATTWTSHTTGVTNEWDDYANATPITDVEAAVQAIWAASGMWPDAMVINRKVFRNLRNCAQIIDRLKYNGVVDVRPSKINESMLASVFDLAEIIVAGTPKNTATEGQAVTIAPIWSDEYAMLCKVARSNDIQEPAIGRTIHWADDGSDIDGMVESYRDETVRGDVVRVRHDVDEKVLYVEAGHLLSNITS